MPRLSSENSYSLGAHNKEKRLMEEGMSGDMIMEITPTTVASSATASAWTRTASVAITNTAGEVHTWLTDDYAASVAIADTSSAGTASIGSTTLSIVEGKADITVSGDAAAWLGGTAQIETITCSKGTGTAQIETISATKGTGTSQVETITCTAGESTGAGNITMTITAAGMPNSPKAVVVAVGLGDSINTVADSLRTALGADADVTSMFTVGGTAADAILTRTVPAANDATLAFGFVDTDTTGVTFGASTDTTAGVAPAAGDITMTVTANGMPNSPKAVVVAIGATDYTAAEVGALLRAALNADTDVSGYFTVGGTGADASITSITPTINDATMDFGFVDTDTTGVTFGASTATQAGVAPAAGDITMSVTAAGMTNSPKDVVVAIGATDYSVSAVGALLRAALTADTDVSSFFTVSGTGADAVITAITPAANDATVAFGYTDTDTTGVTFGASTATQAGVAKETDTLTLSNLSILGYTVTGGTSVETFS